MSKWRVYNDHTITHREKFKEQQIEIPAGGFVLMDYEDAVQFRSQYFPMKKDPQGAPDPTGFKKISLKPDDPNAAAIVTPTEGFICHFDGKKFPTQSSLDFHINENYADRVFKDAALEETIAQEKKQAAQRGPGRPPKEKSA